MIMYEEIKVNDTLNQNLWNEDNTLKEEVKERLLDIVDNFLDMLKEDGIDIDVVDVRFLGSNANYNYTDKSDIDLHIVADFSSLPCEQNVMPQLYNAYKVIFNSKFDIKINGFDVEIYVEDINSPAKSNGVYSLYTGWIKEPVKSDIPNIDWEEFERQFDEWEDRYFDIMDEYTSSELEEGYGYKWKPNKAQAQDFAQKMKEISDFCIENNIHQSSSGDSYYFELNGKNYRVSNHSVEASNQNSGGQWHKEGREKDTTYIHASKTRIIDIYNALKQGKKLDGKGNVINEELEEKYLMDLDKDILSCIKNPSDNLTKLDKCSRYAGSNLVKAYNDPNCKDIKLCVGGINPKGVVDTSKLISHVWLEVDGKKVESRRVSDIYDVTKKDELVIDKSKDLYNQVEEFLNKPSLREDLSPEVDSDLTEGFWATKKINWTGFDGEQHEKEYNEYKPEADSKYKRLCRKPINTLTEDEIIYIYAVRWTIYMAQMIPYQTPEEAIEKILNDDPHKRGDLKECHNFVHSLKFPLTIYRGIRVGEYKSSELNTKTNNLIVSGKQRSCSWTTDINIYKKPTSKFRNLTQIIACEIDSNIVDVANTIFTFVSYSASGYVDSGEYRYSYPENEITLKDNFKQSDLHNLRFVNKDEINEMLYEGLTREVDSEGNPLSNEQVDFFKNSKVRDDKGRLLVVYHGTDAEFDTFKKEFMGTNPRFKYQSGGYGGANKGFFFTNDEWYASKVGKNVKKCYLNITNPLDIKDFGWGSAVGQLDSRKGDIYRWVEDNHNDGIIVTETDVELYKNRNDLNDDTILGFDTVFVAFNPNQIKSIDNKNPSNSNNINEKLEPVDFEIKNLSDSDLLISKNPSDIHTYLTQKGNSFWKMNYYPKTNYYVLIDPFELTHWDVSRELVNNAWTSELDDNFQRWAYAPNVDSIEDNLGEYSEEDFKNIECIEYNDGILICLDGKINDEFELCKYFGEPISKGSLYDLLDFYSQGYDEEPHLKEDYDYDKIYKIKELYKKAYDELIDNSTRLYRYREWASNSNNDYKEYIYNDLKNNKKDSALNLWYNHYRLMTGNYDLSYEDFLNTPITLYRATNVKEDENSNNPFFSYAQDKRSAERFLSQVQNLYGNRSGEIKELQIKPKDTLGMLPSDENEIIVPNNLYQKRITNIENIVNEVIDYANKNNVELPYDRDELLDIFKKEGRDTENFRKHMFDWIDKRKGKLKESKLKEDNNYGYHAGDLGKSEQRERQTGGRGTGHFGTGTYFVGNENKIDGYNDNQYGKGKAPHHIVDFSSYNLYKPSNNDFGYKLHDALSMLNNGYKHYTKYADTYDWFISHHLTSSDDGNFESKDIPEIVSHLNNLLFDYEKINLPNNIDWNTIDQEYEELDDKYYNELKPKYENTIELFDAIEEKIEQDPKFRELRNITKEIRTNIKNELTSTRLFNYRQSKNIVDNLFIALEGKHSKGEIKNALSEVNKHLDDKQGDSLSTIFMKALGYDGVDVRGLDMLDNTTYGSVIYDLKPDSIIENA